MLRLDKAGALKIAAAANKHTLHRYQLMLACVFEHIGQDPIVIFADADQGRAALALRELKDGHAKPPLFFHGNALPLGVTAKKEAVAEEPFDRETAFTKANLGKSGLALAREVRACFAKKDTGNRLVGLKTGVLGDLDKLASNLVTAAGKVTGDYTYGDVVDATRTYVRQNKKEGARYLMRSHYFVLKSGASVLVSHLEEGNIERTGEGSGESGSDFTSANTKVRLI